MHNHDPRIIRLADRTPALRRRQAEGPAELAAVPGASAPIVAHRHRWARRTVRHLRAWHFDLRQKHRHRKLTVEYIADIPIVVLPDVFNPKLFHTGEALARQVLLSDAGPQTRVLDMGTGSGIGAVFAAKRGSSVVAVDINPEAVRCARINVLLNQVADQVAVLPGDLFEPVRGQQFDLVLFNPPFFTGTAEEPWQHAWRSEDAWSRFLAELPRVLAPTGRALVALSSVAVGPLAELADSPFHQRIIWSRSLINERLAVVELRPMNREGDRWGRPA